MTDRNVMNLSVAIEVRPCSAIALTLPLQLLNSTNNKSNGTTPFLLEGPRLHREACSSRENGSSQAALRPKIKGIYHLPDIILYIIRRHMRNSMEILAFVLARLNGTWVHSAIWLKD